MSPGSALSTIAEVAIAIAGFGGVVAAIVSVTPRGVGEAVPSQDACLKMCQEKMAGTLFEGH
jgi:hypothetical protein